MTLIRTLLLSLALSLGLAFSASAQILDLNTASVAELAAGLSGIGEKKAAAIVAYRETIGSFQSVEQLTEVSGIGPRLLENNRDKLSVGAMQVPATQVPAAQVPTAQIPTQTVPGSAAVVTQ